MDKNIFTSINRGSAWGTLLTSLASALAGLMMAFTIIGAIPGVGLCALSLALAYWSFKAIKRKEVTDVTITVLSGVILTVTGLATLTFIITEIVNYLGKKDGVTN